MLRRWIEKKFWEYWSDDLVNLDMFTKEEADQVLRDVMSEDLILLLKSEARSYKSRYFNASDNSQRDVIRGEFLKTIQLIKRLEKLRDNEKSAKNPATKKFGGRYAR